jgi:hypothetical protein
MVQVEKKRYLYYIGEVSANFGWRFSYEIIADAHNFFQVILNPVIKVRWYINRPNLDQMVHTIYGYNNIHWDLTAIWN